MIDIATIDMGQRKWERKMANAGERWKAGTAGATQRWAAGLQAAGAAPGPLTTQAYEAGLSATSASDFQASVSGKGSKWAENFRRGISR